MIYNKWHNYVAEQAVGIRPIFRYVLLPVVLLATIIITTIDNIYEMAMIILKGGK